MALLAKQATSVNGVDLTMNTAAGGGDTVLVDRPGVFILVRNGDATPKTITIVDPRTQYGQPSPDVPNVVAAGANRPIALPIEFADANGLVSITYSAVTSVTVGVFTV